MNAANLTAVEATINYQFTNQQLGKATLYAAGSPMAALYGGNDGNKVMAMLGDKIMATILLSDLIESGTDRGYINDRVTALVANQNLATICVNTGIIDHIIGNPSQRRAPPSPKTCTVTIEAIIGAVFVDSGMNIDVTRGVMRTLGLSVTTTPSTS